MFFSEGNSKSLFVCPFICLSVICVSVLLEVVAQHQPTLYCPFSSTIVNLVQCKTTNLPYFVFTVSDDSVNEICQKLSGVASKHSFTSCQTFPTLLSYKTIMYEYNTHIAWFVRRKLVLFVTPVYTLPYTELSVSG